MFLHQHSYTSLRDTKKYEGYSFSKRYDSLHKILGFMSSLGRIGKPFVSPREPFVKLVSGIYDYLYNTVPALYTEEEVDGGEDRVLYKAFSLLLKRARRLRLFTLHDHELSLAVAVYLAEKLLEELEKNKGKKDPVKLLEKIDEMVSKVEEKAELITSYSSSLQALAKMIGDKDWSRGRAVSMILEGEYDEKRLRLARELVLKIRGEEAGLESAYNSLRELGPGVEVAYYKPIDSLRELRTSRRDTLILSSRTGKILATTRNLYSPVTFADVSFGKEPPSKLVVLIDKSGSIGENIVELTALGIASTLFLKKHGGKAGVILFDTQPYDITGELKSVDKVLDVLLKTRSGGGTSIARAIGYADKKYQGYRRLLITDGCDNAVRNVTVLFYKPGSCYDRYGWRKYEDENKYYVAESIGELKEIVRDIVVGLG